MNLGQQILVVTLRVYRLTLSPMLAALTGPMGLGCRFTPTCSRYAIEAIERHGAIQGGSLALRRLCQCHPWGRSGFDPVPARQASAPAANEPVVCSLFQTGSSTSLLRQSPHPQR